MQVPILYSQIFLKAKYFTSSQIFKYKITVYYLIKYHIECQNIY